jgi:histidine triad (HIT) family protein
VPQDCLFCRIAAGELPVHSVYEDDHVLAFLDLHPIRAGHTLVIPRAHHDWFEDLPADLAARVMTVGQQLAHGMKALYGVERVSLFFTGIHVRHAHAHVVPMHHMHDVTSACYLQDGLESFTPPPSPPAEELAQVARSLRAALPATA